MGRRPAVRSRCCMNHTRRFLITTPPMAAGWPTVPTKRESGKHTLWKSPIRRGSGWCPAGAGAGHQGFWSPSGREIFFTTFFAPLRIMVTSVSFEGGVFHPGQPHPWSPVAIPNHAGEGASQHHNGSGWQALCGPDAGRAAFGKPGNVRHELLRRGSATYRTREMTALIIDPESFVATSGHSA